MTTEPKARSDSPAHSARAEGDDALGNEIEISPALIEAGADEVLASPDWNGGQTGAELLARRLFAIACSWGGCGLLGGALQTRGGGDNYGGMERLTRLETHFEYIRRDLNKLTAG